MSDRAASGPRAVAAGGLTRQALLYSASSSFALGVDVATFLSLAAWGMMASVAAVVGYSVGLVAHFLLSVRMVFDAAATGRSGLDLFARFAVSGVIGLVLTTAIVALLADVAGAAPIVAKASAVLTSFTLVFVLRRSVVFSRADDRRSIRSRDDGAAGR